MRAGQGAQAAACVWRAHLEVQLHLVVSEVAPAGPTRRLSAALLSLAGCQIMPQQGKALFKLHAWLGWHLRIRK